MNLLDGEAPLHLAAKEGHAKAVQLLLELGADVEAEDGNGFTALKVRHGTLPLWQHAALPSLVASTLVGPNIVSVCSVPPVLCGPSV